MTLKKSTKMSTKSHITTELSDSISNVLGKNVKILYKSLIRMESRGDKVDNRVLVVSAFRIFITTTKVPTRVDNGFHLMEIEALESKKANHLSITLIHEHKPVSILIGEEGSPDGVINAIHALAAAFDDLFPNVAMEDIISKVNLPFQIQPVSGTRKHSTCGDFSNQYAAMCDLCQTPFRAEVAWDIDTIYLAHDIRMLHLKDFDHLDQRDLIPLLIALQHNTWFEGVCGDGVRVGGEAWEALSRVVRCAAPPPQRLSWRAAALRHDHAARLGHALARARTPPAMHTIDFSQNHIEDKGAISILTGLANNPDGLRHIALSQCGLTGKTVSHLAAILNDSACHLSTLSHLDLSNNNLKDDVHNLYNFLAQPNVLTHLNLTNTETTLENMWGALLRGCAARLSSLLVGRNPWSTARRPRDPPPSFRQFFTACLALADLDFSYCKMPPDVLKSLLLGLACNESAAGVKLCLSGVLASAQAAHVLESCIHGVRCLQTLDLSDNSMEYELSGIVRAIGKNHSITHLSLSRLTGKRSYAPPLIQALVHVLQEPDTALTSLDLSDCKLKGDLYGLLNALGGARRLRSLDVGGNVAGDAGARLLAKALQCNCTLHTLHIDRNAFSLQGLTDIATALRRSVSVRRVDFPGCDAAAGGRGASERVATLWRDLHERLSSNSTSAQCYRLRALALERAWAGGEAAAALAAQAAAALPPAPLPAALERAAAAAHHLLHQYLQRCSEVFAAMGGAGAGAAGELVTLQAVRDAMAPCNTTLQDLLNEAVESLALSACESVDNVDTDPTPSSEADIPDLLTPISHSGATPLGIRRRERVRRVRPKSVAEQQCSSNEMLSLPPLHAEAADALADLPAHTLRHLVKGRPRRAKTRAPSRPITDQSQDIDEGLEEFWRTCRTPPGSEEASLSARTPLTSRSLHSLSSLASPSPASPSPHPASPSPSPSRARHSPTLQRDDTMYSVTSGESTPVLLECEVSRCKSSDNVGTRAPATPPPSRSSDNVNTMGNGCVRGAGKARPWSVAGVNADPAAAACTTEGVEACVGGSIVGITPGAALTSNQLSDAILY
ncbi:PREDICTED: leucine-rich repeat-containing protein 16A isoform X2 [Papilio xuthus]|uniref:Leucine-rich repeat-containing protein 16A isoform X2 n=1 Tax=Papilio xuthus TaxID=66420 RepID=A0AAJ6ZGM1_PAPXU|nr:PREDICTED: leucine-rich repeat-containing protein 16A isoform X2 [Papilio xuthus]